MKLSFFTQEAFSQILTYRFVIQFQAQISKHDTQDKDAHGYVPSLAQRIELILNQPCIEQIHQRIMDHINRIGYIPQKFSYLCRLHVRSCARRSYPKNDRESHNHTKRFINTIHAKRLHSFEIRNSEQGNQCNGTDPESTLHLHRLEVTRHQHTQREREKHT